jgi:hypothetical protein
MSEVSFRPLPRRRMSTAVLLERRTHLPALDPDRLRADIDAVLDTSL